MAQRLFPFSPLCLIGMLGMAAMAQPSAPIVAASIERIQATPPSDPDSFDFAVLADSNTLQPLEQADVFKQMIREIGILEPAFVVEPGDIVLGGAAEGVPAQWDLFEKVIAVSKVPYVAAPGNHDISDEATERIWRERMGPTPCAFDYGNSRFILLNSEEVGAIERISDEQVAWLKEQLETTHAKNIFVFLHRPYFAHEGDPDNAEAEWQRCWANVAETFRGHPVRAVFAGHEHRYRDCGTRDGVHYVICGGASVYGMTAPEDEGCFNHYLLVRVRGENASWAVVKPGAILPEDAVTSTRIDELFNVRNKWIAGEEVFARLGESIDRDLTVTIRNPHDTAMSSTLTWTIPPGWAVDPATAEFAIPANDVACLTFHVRADNPESVRFPVPLFHTLYERTQYGPPVDVAQDLRFVPILLARHAEQPIAIDGVLGEWAGAEMAPSTYPVGFDAQDKDDLECRTGFLWDDDHLYMAVQTHDNEYHQPYAGDIVWSADNVEMFLDQWSWGLTLTKDGPEVFLYEGVGMSAETVNTDVKLAVVRNGTDIVYEAAFPKACLAPLELAPGNSFRFNALMNDLDPSGPVKARHWLQLVPQSGSPGSPRPRVKVLLER